MKNTLSKLPRSTQQLISRLVVDEMNPGLMQILPKGCPNVAKKFGVDRSTFSIFRSEVCRVKL